MAEFEWHGDKIKDRARRANGRAVVAIGENIATEAKINAHVISGTLRRSIHVAAVGYLGADDEQVAADEARGGQGTDVPNASIAEVTYEGVGAHLEVGSWLPYACVEEVGRGHRFMEPALESVRTRSADIVRQAYEEEGLA